MVEADPPSGPVGKPPSMGRPQSKSSTRGSKPPVVPPDDAATVPVFVDLAPSPQAADLAGAADEAIPPLGRVAPSPPLPRAKRLVRRARFLWNSYRLGEDLSYFRGVDPDRNEKLRIPSSESVIYHCLWLTEFYTPSEADEMLRRLEAMRASMKIGGGHDFARSVREDRANPYSGGWHNIGYLIPDGSRRQFIGPDTFETDLPRGVTHGPAFVMSMTPSLTALVVQFIFDDSVTEEWVSPLAKAHTTHAERKLGMIHFPGPKELKRSEAADARRRIRARCAAWIERTIPGYFAALPGSDNHPAVEFITLRDQRPLGSDSLDDYLDALDLRESSDTWTVDGSFRMRRGSWFEPDARVAVLAAREDELHGWEGWQGLGHGWNRQGVMVGLHVHSFNEFVAALAVDELISSYEAKLAKMRDRLNVGSAAGGDAALSVLERQLADLSRGVSAICPELVRMTEEPWFIQNLRDLSWHAEWYPLSAPGPAETLVRSYRERAEALASSERALRETLVASAQVAAAREGLRLQRNARMIAVFGAALAALSLLGWDRVQRAIDALFKVLFG
jgi:hypothetical protein